VATNIRDLTPAELVDYIGQLQDVIDKPLGMMLTSGDLEYQRAAAKLQARLKARLALLEAKEKGDVDSRT
jgi:hypothetical protein